MARTFDGSNDQIACGSGAAIDELGPFTACAFVRITSNVTDERQILTKMNSAYNGKMFLAAAGGGGSNNKIIVVVSASDSIYAESAADVLVVNTWRVVISSWNGGISVSPKIYACTIGGALAEVSYTTQDGGSGVVTDAAATLRIGARDPLDATFFAGGLAECALWNRVLTDDELRALGRGFTPAFFPRGRVFYCPITGRQTTEMNWAGTTHGTVTDTTFLDHPSVMSLQQPVVDIHTGNDGGGGGGGSYVGALRGITRAIQRGIGRA